jgi:membrane-associated protease RseP (regulator of RpoE activity)
MIRYGLITLILLHPLACTSAISDKKTSPPTYDIVVYRIFPNSPADKANLKTGDLILKVDEEPVTSLNELKDALAKIHRGEKCYLTINRNDRKTKIAIVAGKRRRYRYGFLFKLRDTEIAEQIKIKIWSDEINPKYKYFTIPFQLLTMMKKSSYSPKKKVLFHLKELLTNKGYLFTENFLKADFIAKVEFKKPESNQSPARKRKKLPFDALRVIFVENDRQKPLLAETNEQPPFLKVTGTLDEKKARFYGAKEYVFSMLDAMIEDFPPYQNKKKLADDFLTSEKKRFEPE